MKHIYRRSLLPLLLGAIMIFSLCFTALYQKSLEEDRQQIETIYNTTRVVIQVVPQNEGSRLALSTYRGDLTAALEEVVDHYSLMNCRYSLREPEARPGYSSIYGTNNLYHLSRDQNIAVTLGEGWDEERFFTFDPEAVPCLLDESMAQRLNLKTGDTLVLAGTIWIEQDMPSAPSLTFVLAGTYEGKQSKLEPNGIITGQEIFLHKPDGLLFCGDMMYDCCYRSFILEIDPKYNRNMEPVMEKIETTLADRFDYISTAKTMQDSIRPIEHKLQVQEPLEQPLRALCAAAVVLVALLLGLSMKREAFLRILQGERRLLVFLKLYGSFLAVLLFWAVAALVCCRLMAGPEWLPGARELLGYILAGSVLGAGIPLGLCCSKNLIKLYQKQEG